MITDPVELVDDFLSLPFAERKVLIDKVFASADELADAIDRRDWLAFSLIIELRQGYDLPPLIK